jgi:arginine decarboxylase
MLAGLSGLMISCGNGNDDESSAAGAGEVFGNRIPKEYFVTSGKGDTDIGPGDDPWETGSYDLALMDAKIENFNVTQYSSVLPPESKEIPISEAEATFRHGAVIETIMASVNGVKGNTLCTGVGRIQVRRLSDGKHIGGFAAEYEKVHTEEIALADAEKAAEEMLHTSLMGEVNRRYSTDEYEFFDEQHEINAFKVEKSYGTSLVSLCWISYIYTDEPEVQ